MTTVAPSTSTSSTAPPTNPPSTSTTTAPTEPATTTSTEPAPPTETTTTEVATETATSVESTTTTTEPTGSDGETPDAPLSEAEQIAVIAGLDAPDVTQEQVVAAVDTLIDAGLTATAATALATNTKVLESIEPSQAAAVFAAIAVSNLSPEQVTAIATALTSAPPEIKKAFEATIDIYGDGFDTYVPIGSVVPVATRKTLVAAMAAVTSVAAAAAAQGSAMSGTSGSASFSGTGSKE